MPHGDAIATVLPAILRAFESALRSVDSPLLKSDLARTQVLEHARSIVLKTANRLTGSAATETINTLPRDIGATRAVTGVHPRESLRAAWLLFGAVMGQLDGPVGLQLTSAEIATVAMTLHGVISDNLVQAADSYMGVLINRMR